MTKHTDQVASVLRRAVQEVLARGLNDPRVRGLISVTNVRVADDMANATVFVSVVPEEHAPLTMHGLKAAASHVRHQVGERVRIRRMPTLSFKLDESLKKEASVIHAIDEARRADRVRELPETERGPDADGDGPAGIEDHQP